MRARAVQVRNELPNQLPNFQLQYPVADIQTLADEYMDSKEGPEDRKMEAAGKRINDGDFTLANLKVSYRWKSTRRIGLLANNSDAEIEQALKQAIAAVDVREAIDALTRLDEVGVKTASSILTAIAPERYTALDFRALAALGSKNGEHLDLYVNYLEFCKRTAKQYGVNMRTFDRANWQWSRNKSERESGNKRFHCKTSN